MIHTWIVAQHKGAGSLILTCKFQESNIGHETWWQILVPTEPSGKSLFLIVLLFSFIFCKAVWCACLGVSVCLWWSVLYCHSTHVEIRGEPPWLSILKFCFEPGSFYCLLLHKQTRCPVNFQASSISTCHLVVGEMQRSTHDYHM